MRYIWNMGVSGSVLTLAYLCGRYFLRDRLSPQWRYRLLKMLLLYYLFPLTFLKGIYEDILHGYLRRTGQWDNSIYVDSQRSLILIHEGKRIFNTAFRWELAVGGIWLAAGIIVFVWMLVRYLAGMRQLSYCGSRGKPAEDIGAYDAIRRRHGIKRRVRYLDSTLADREGRTAFTMGILRPVILYPACRDRAERELIVEHELIHIRHVDLLWQMLAAFACILHCINPLIWWLRREMGLAAELYCDESVLRCRDDGQRRIYAQVLLGMAQRKKEKGWAVTLSGQGKELKERLEAIMGKKKKYFGEIASALMVAAAVLLNSFTVMAYQDVQVWAGNGDQDLELLEPGMEMGFQAKGSSRECKFRPEEWRLKILYDDQFVDEEGNIYPIAEAGDAVYASCRHQYEEGTAYSHAMNGSGGCAVTVYKAQRCTLCGIVIQGEQIGVFQYNVCTH